MQNPYPETFFAAIRQGAWKSADVILGYLFRSFRPASILDVGCGQGAWLAAGAALGVTELTGVDGPWVDANRMLHPMIRFVQADLEKGIDLGQRFDLCISVEVAEHISFKAAETFVETLSNASDVIIFSAAIPLQGGVRHINEQWQSFWARLFEERDYQCLDFFRPGIWNDSTVECWYRQNLLLYVKRSHPMRAEIAARSGGSQMLDVVHPDIYTGNLNDYVRQLERPSLKLCARMLGRWFAQRFGTR